MTKRCSGVVSIGGAPFVPPFSRILQPIDCTPTQRTLSSRVSSPSLSSSPTSSIGDAISPSSSFSSSSSSGSARRTQDDSVFPSMTTGQDGIYDDDESSEQRRLRTQRVEAALQYSSQLHRHTSLMWEKERHVIERQRIERNSAPPTSSATTPPVIPSSSRGSAAPSQAPPPPVSKSGITKASLTRSMGLDMYWPSRRKRHTKNAMSMY